MKDAVLDVYSNILYICLYANTLLITGVSLLQQLQLLPVCFIYTNNSHFVILTFLLADVAFKLGREYYFNRKFQQAIPHFVMACRQVRDITSCSRSLLPAIQVRISQKSYHSGTKMFYIIYVFDRNNQSVFSHDKIIFMYK